MLDETGISSQDLPAVAPAAIPCVADTVHCGSSTGLMQRAPDSEKKMRGADPPSPFGAGTTTAFPSPPVSAQPPRYPAPSPLQHHGPAPSLPQHRPTPLLWFSLQLHRGAPNFPAICGSGPAETPAASLASIAATYPGSLTAASPGSHPQDAWAPLATTARH